MRSFFLLLTFLIPSASSAEEYPNSVQRWKDASIYFWSLDFSDESSFKKSLIEYYSNVYSGERFEYFKDWIERGSLESEHYSSVYSDLKDNKWKSINKIDDGKYQAISIQSSCYSLDYSPPRMETLVEDYNVSNISQEEIDSWLQDQGPAPNSSVCLTIQWSIQLLLDENQLIKSEHWSRVETRVKLEA